MWRAREDGVMFCPGRETGARWETTADGLPDPRKQPADAGCGMVPVIRVEAGRIGILRFDSAETGG